MDNMEPMFKRFKLITAGWFISCLVVALPAVAQTPQPPTSQKPTSVAPLARISAPVTNQVLRGTAEIFGTASLPNFSRYEVSYAPESRPGQWTLIYGDTRIVSDGSLAVWDTRVVSSTTYAIRLQVFGTEGVELPASVIRNVTISNTLTGGSPATIISPDSSGTLSATNRSSVTNSNPLRNVNINLADIPQGFTLGARYAAYAFAALFAYLVAKRLVYFLWSRRQRWTNYGD